MSVALTASPPRGAGPVPVKGDDDDPDNPAGAAQACRLHIEHRDPVMLAEQPGQSPFCGSAEHLSLMESAAGPVRPANPVHYAPSHQRSGACFHGSAAPNPQEPLWTTSPGRRPKLHDRAARQVEGPPLTPESRPGPVRRAGVTGSRSHVLGHCHVSFEAKGCRRRAIPFGKFPVRRLVTTRSCQQRA